MEVIINRESVCLGDDINDHMKTYILSDDVTYEELFQKIMGDRYIPSVSGNNVVWVLASNSCKCIFSFFTRTNKIRMGIVEKRLSVICRNNNQLLFRYFSSPIKWKEYIRKMYDDDSYTMWRDGWLDELGYCDFVMELGDEM